MNASVMAEERVRSFSFLLGFKNSRSLVCVPLLSECQKIFVRSLGIWNFELRVSNVGRNQQGFISFGIGSTELHGINKTTANVTKL
jgi:hypothetical protein